MGGRWGKGGATFGRASPLYADSLERQEMPEGGITSAADLTVDCWVNPHTTTGLAARLRPGGAGPHAHGTPAPSTRQEEA